MSRTNFKQYAKLLALNWHVMYFLPQLIRQLCSANTVFPTQKHVRLALVRATDQSLDFRDLHVNVSERKIHKTDFMYCLFRKKEKNVKQQTERLLNETDCEPNTRIGQTKSP